MLDRYLENLTKEASDQHETQRVLKRMPFYELAKLAGVKLAYNVCASCGSTMEKRGSMLRCSCGMMKRASSALPQEELEGRLKKVTEETPSSELELPANSKSLGENSKELGEKTSSAHMTKKSSKEKTAILTGTLAGALTAPEGKKWEGAGWGALGGLGGAAASGIVTRALAGRPLYIPGMAASGLAGYYLSKRMTGGKKKTSSSMPPFLKQDRPKKVKEVYKALKRDHPEYSAGKKARIASSKGKTKKGAQDPYPVKPGWSAGAGGAFEAMRKGRGSLEMDPKLRSAHLPRTLAGMGLGTIGGAGLGTLAGFLLRKRLGIPGGEVPAMLGVLGGGLGMGVGTTVGSESAIRPWLRERGIQRTGVIIPTHEYTQQAAKKYLDPAVIKELKKESTVDPELLKIGQEAGKLLAKTSGINDTPVSPDELEESIQEAQSREDIPGRSRAWQIGGGVGGGILGAAPGAAIGALTKRRILGLGLGAVGAGAGAGFGQHVGKQYGAEEAAADKAVALLRALRAHQAGAGAGYGAGLRQGYAAGRGFEGGGSGG